MLGPLNGYDEKTTLSPLEFPSLLRQGRLSPQLC